MRGPFDTQYKYSKTRYMIFSRARLIPITGIETIRYGFRFLPNQIIFPNFNSLFLKKLKRDFTFVILKNNIILLLII